MAESNEIIPLSYIYGFADPGNFPGWYTFYARSDGTSPKPGNFDSLVRAFVEHLGKPENKNRKAVSHNQNPDAFTPEQVAQIDALLKTHNEEVSGLEAEVVAK
ncbi:hypothetical protein HYX06_05690 [Candidatus Woesearchaeota archaeon]|nr:hypothetical protein [Candidatus Woesearchaeota archaeon]